jgi:mono/diheme cytochrome c family protein
MKPVLPIFILTVCLGKSLSAADGDPVDFAHQIVPVLKQHCVECHGGDKSKGGFSLNTRRLFLEDESAIPGNAAESYFLELIEDPDPEYRMPQDDNPAVPEDEVALLKRWVDQGMVWEPGFTFGEPTYEPPLRPRT